MSGSGSRSFGGNRGDNNRNVRGRRLDQTPAPPAVPALPPVPVVAPPQPPVVAPPQPPPVGGGGGAPPPPLVQVRAYSVIPGFPPYPLDGDQTNVYQLFKKKLSYTDVNSILHVTGKNLPNFHEDVRDLLGVGEGGEGDVRLRLVRGNELVADGDIKLRRHDFGTPVSLRWRLFALAHHVPLAEMEDQVVYAWCEWVKVVGVEKHDLRIIIKLPN